MKTYTSISDFLEAHGYVAEGEGYVNRTTKLPAVRIEYADWKDLTVDAFIEKAKAQRWVSPYSDEEGSRIKEAWRKEHPMPLFMDEEMGPTTKAVAEWGGGGPTVAQFLTTMLAALKLQDRNPLKITYNDGAIRHTKGGTHTALHLDTYAEEPHAGDMVVIDEHGQVKRVVSKLEPED